MREGIWWGGLLEGDLKFGWVLEFELGGLRGVLVFEDLLMEVGEVGLFMVNLFGVIGFDWGLLFVMVVGLVWWVLIVMMK